MSEAIAYCGLVCQTCPIYIATREESKAEQQKMRAEVAQLCREQYGMEYGLEDITDCDGCRSDGGRLFSACDTCHIRSCARQKGFENCAFCGEYACKSLEEFFSTDPTARRRLDEIRTSMQ